MQDSLTDCILVAGRGANLVVVLPSIIGTWAQQTAKALGSKDLLLGAWALRYGYTTGRITEYVPRVSTSDGAKLEMLPNGPVDFHKAPRTPW